MSWLWVCSRLAPAGGADVLEEHAVDQPVVLLEVDQAIAVGPEDLADVLLGQGGHALVVLGALDDDLVGADAGHHVVDAVAPLVEAPLDLQRGEPVGDDADPPARSVGPRAEAAVGEDLRRRLVLVPLAERAGGRRVRRRVLRAEVVGPLGPLVRDDHPAADDRVFPQVGHDSVSSTAARGWPGHRSSERCTDLHLPEDSLEIARRGGQLEDALARRPVEAGVAPGTARRRTGSGRPGSGRAGRTGRPAPGWSRSRPGRCRR